MRPETPAYRSLPGPHDITRVILPNGITLLVRSNFNSPSVVLNGYLTTGAVNDPRELLGLAHFTALSLMRGTQQHSMQEIYEGLESVGASMGLGASVLKTKFFARALAEDLPLLLNTLSEVLRQPVFPTEQLERLRAQILTGLAIRAQDTADMASLTFDEIVFAGHPYGLPEDGYTETVQQITRQDILNFHANTYGPQGMALVVVGAVTAQQALELVTATLGDWSNPNQPPAPSLPAPTPLTQTVRRHVPIPGKSQTDLVIGTLGPHRRSPDFWPAVLGNSILGQFGMMGRIGDAVREKAGLAYYASTSLNASYDTGSWEVSAGVNPANVEKAVELILKELTRFVQEPVSAEELTDSQTDFIGSLPLSLESNIQVAGGLLNLEQFQLGLDYYQRYPDLVRAVTPEQILEVARAYLDVSRLAIVSAGSEAA